MKKSIIEAVITAAMNNPNIITRLTEILRYDSEAEEKLAALLTGVKVGIKSVSNEKLAQVIEDQYGYQVLSIRDVMLERSSCWTVKVCAHVRKTRYFKNVEDAKQYAELGDRADVISSPTKGNGFFINHSIEKDEKLWMTYETIGDAVEYDIV